MNIPGTTIYLCPTLQEKVEGWMAMRWTKRAAVAAIVALNLGRYHRGKGRKAANRAAKLELTREQVEADSWVELEQPDNNR